MAEFVKVTEPVTGVVVTVSKESVQARLWKASEPKAKQARKPAAKAVEAE